MKTLFSPFIVSLFLFIFLSFPHYTLSAQTNCKSGTILCDTGKNCIPKESFCNKVKDCEDGSDEDPLSCQFSSIATFKANVTKMMSSLQDLVKYMLSNFHGLLHLIGRESHCKLRCKGSRECIPESYRCDGLSQCEDNSDEQNCFASKLEMTCPEFRCHDASKCLLNSKKCNGVSDCQDGSDEKYCKFECQKNGHFLCTKDDKGLCIHSSLKCDGKKNCPEGEDEDSALCRKIFPRSLTFEGEKSYEEPSPENESKSKKTNNIVNCTENEFSCGGECIPLKWTCDGITDCSDESDEAKNLCKKKHI